MKSFVLLAALTLVVPAAHGAGVAAASTPTTGGRAADTSPPERYAADLDRAFRAYRMRSLAAAAPAQINVVFHVHSGPGLEGNLDEDRVRAQMAALNDAYRATGLHFTLAEIRRYPDSRYFLGGCFPTTELGIAMKNELAVDPVHYVNVYSCKLALPYIAGYGTLPNEFAEGDHQHGVIVDYATLPGSAAPLDLGHTLVHEMGHYLGLLHTFQGGCDDPGDGVADTPAEAAAAYGCALGRDTCPAAGADPVENYMDYSDDRCTNTFSALQGTRMHAAIAAFRPGLLSAEFAIVAGMTGNWYDPAQSGHGFILEVLPGNILLAEWFVFSPSGGPAWIVATGPITGNKAVLQAYSTNGPGGRFPPAFDPARVQNEPWGEITFTFTDCSHGTVNWQPVAAGYTAGAMPLARLTLPAGLTCP